MSKKIQTGVICALLAGKKFVFDDADTIQEIYGLGPEMFDVPNKFLTANELASMQAMIASVEKATTLKDKYDVLQGTRQTSFGAGRAALTTWFRKQKVSATLADRIDAVWEKFELLPLQLIQEMPDEAFPDVRDADPAKEDIALAIFGDRALGTTLRGDLREAMAPIIHHNWERHRKRFSRAKVNMDDKRLDAINRCNVIEEGKVFVSPKMLRDATRAVKAYSEAISWFPKEVEKIQGVGELEEFLKHIVVGAVAKAKGVTKETLAPDIVDSEDPVENTPAKSRGRACAKAAKEVHLHPGEVNLIWPAARTCGLPRLTLAWDFFRNLNDTTLNHILQFPDGRPTLFAKFRSISRKCTWDDGVSHLFVKENKDMLPLTLLWHQRVGVAALVTKFWQAEESPDGMPGVLIADEVGLGKTVLVMGTIAFIIDAYWVHQLRLGSEGRAESLPAGLDRAKVRQAPILGDRPFFVGQTSIPDLPHIIIVPNSLLSQWTSELRTFFAAKTIEIYQFPTALKDFASFWTGAWATSKMPFINRIILVTHSMMATAGKVFDLRKGKAGHNARKASDEKRHVINERSEKTCLWYKRNFVSCTVDEGHDFRNQNNAWYAVLEVMKVSRVRLFSTATPLFTSPKDLCNIGRLLRVPYFTGHNGDDLENEEWKALRAARRVISKEDKELAARHTIQRMAGSKENHQEPESKARVRAITTAWIMKIKLGYNGRVIRRTVESQRFDGKKINDSLPPYKMIIVPVHLDDDEMFVIDKDIDSLAGRGKLDIDDTSTLSAKFYRAARTKVAFPFHESPNYSPILTYAEYYDVRSTKVEILMTILRWHLINDANGVYRDLDLELMVEEQQELDDEYDEETDMDTLGMHALRIHLPDLMKMGTRKILVYTEFPMMEPLITSILTMHNIFPLTLNGTHTVQERNEIIHKFTTVPEERVLLFSAVGAVGLNLTVANIVILFDQCWSRMLVNQIIGRAWRLGQEDTVLVYNMVAVGTVDVLMVDHGEGKGRMLGQFLSTQKCMYAPVSHITTSNGIEATFDKIQRAARGERATLTDDDADDDDSEIEIHDGPPAAGSSQRASTSRSSASAAGSSRQSATSKSDKKGTNKKTTKTYGGTQRARNIETTGDDEGETFDLQTIDIDDDHMEAGEEDEPAGDSAVETEDDDADRAPAKGKGKARSTGKGKERAQPAKSTSKARAKAKMAPGSSANDPIQLDDHRRPDDTDLHASRPSGPHKEPAANADGDSTKRTHADVDDRMSDVQSNSGSHREPSSNAGGSAVDR
ncbi:P-loop containing nucleoside triphosphate hydrolase protein [Suillus lakei]|nr:P-loop containing nucleoside triphosphate hydrolase protein [Suillus lakei]